MYEQSLSLSLSLKRSFIIIFSLISLLGYGYFAFAVIPPNTTLDPVTTNPTECSGPTPWNNADCVISSSLITADNGLISSSGTVGLGGELSGATTIDRNGYDFRITNGNMFMGGITLPNMESLGTYYVDYDSHVTGLGVLNGGGNGQFAQMIWQDFNSPSHNSQIYVTENGIELSKNTSDDYGTHDGLRFMVGSLDGDLSPHFNLRGIDNNPQHVNTIWENTVDPTENNWTYDKLAVIRNDGSWQWYKYPSSRDDSTSVTPQNVLYTDASGNILSSPISELAFNNSDETLKTITSYSIANNQTSILDMVNDIKTIRYYWNDDIEQSKENIGFIAQNIQQVFPELVRTGTNGKLAVNYAGMTPVLVEAIQELNLKVGMLELASGNTENVFEFLRNWFESAANGIRSIVVQDKICVEDECLNKYDIQELLQLKSEYARLSNVIDTERGVAGIEENNEGSVVIPEIDQPESNNPVVQIPNQEPVIEITQQNA